MKHPDFSSITEVPGLQATQEQLERLYHRYHFAKYFCKGKDVIEVACGSGIGLSYLASFSKSVVGCDIDKKNLSIAKGNHANVSTIKIERMDAERLSFADNSFDTVLLYEAIYYFPYPEKFIQESWRILREGGTLIICSVNKDWKDFHPSPFAKKYFSANELFEIVAGKYNDTKVFGAFKTEEGVKANIMSLIKKLAMKFSLIPGSLKLRAYLKRIFIGETLPLPEKIVEGMTTYIPPVELSPNKTISDFKIIYCTGIK